MQNTLRVILPIDEDLQALIEQEEGATAQDTAQDTMQVPCKYHASKRFIKSIRRGTL